jgi:LuxR family transcriptional regulator, quorum-sensing system regulator SolR
LRFEDYLERSHRATTASALACLYSEAIAESGYEDGLLSSLRGLRVEHVAWFDIPPANIRAYVERRWQRIDSILACSLRVCRPFIWSGDAGARAAERSDPSRPPLDEGRISDDHDGEWGIAFPFHAPGQRLDLVSIKRCGTAPADLGSSELLHAISFHAWTRYLELSQERFLLEASGVALTGRELEILDWCKKGKTRPEIAQILSISPKTVEFHLANVMNKLGASNQTAAVVIALQRGLLEL